MSTPLSTLISSNDVDVDDLGIVLRDMKSSNCEPVACLAVDELLRLIVSKFDPAAAFLTADSVLSFVWERLNTGHWSEVGHVWRQLFTAASLIKIASVLRIIPSQYDEADSVLEDVIKMCDVALMMGAPIPGKCAGTSASMATRLSRYLTEKESQGDCSKGTGPSSKRRKTEDTTTTTLGRFSNVAALDVEDGLSLEDFLEGYKKTGQPVVIRGAVEHWPACDPNSDHQWSTAYLKKVAGFRTVPVELGRRYTDDSWTQSLMTIRHFVDRYLDADDDSGSNRTVGYLAQHELFDQIPELSEDFEVPEYCYTGGEDEDIYINSWIGPRGTVSPLHTDPKHNCLAQVVGSKHIILFPESETPSLAAFEEGILTNTSQIDLEQPEELLQKAFPDFPKARGFECILNPGDLLYIPPRCWHFVKSLETSFSVSFWFQ